MTELPADAPPLIFSDRGLMRCSRIAAWSVAATGTLVLIGWMLDVQALKRVLSGSATMVPNTALAFLLAGAAASQLHHSGSAKFRRVIQLMALAVGLLGALNLVEYVVGWDLRIDQILFASPSTYPGVRFPGRMSPVSALNFILLGSGLLILASQRRTLQPVGDVVTYIAGLIGVISLAGYVYAAPSLYQLSFFSAMAVHTAAAFVVLSIAMLTTSPIRGGAAILVGDDIGARLARSLLPVAIAAPLLVGYLRLIGQRLGWYGTEFGLALSAIANVVIFSVVIFKAAASLRGADLKRRDSERAQRIIETELKQTNERFATASEAAGIGFWDFDIRSNSLRWDERMFVLYGRPKSDGEQPYSLWADSLHPDDRRRSEQELTDALKGRRDFHTEFRIVHPNGDVRHLKASARVIRDAGGHPLEMVGVNIDITERKRATEQFRMALEVAPTGMVMMDGAGKITLVNKQIESLFGYPRSELLGQTIELLVPERFRAHHPELRKAYLRTPEARTMGAGRELYGLRKDGSEVPIEVGLSPLRTLQGDFVLGSISDVTKRKRSEEALRDSERRYRFLTEAMPQIVWTARSDGNVDFFNQQTYDYTGLTLEQSRDWGWKLAVHPEDLQNGLDRWTRSFTTGTNYEVEYRLKRAADGTYRWHLVRAFPLRDSHGAIIQWVGTCTDIDDQKRAEEALREAYGTLEQRVNKRTEELGAAKAMADRANAAKSEFLANMSHEIRTPLNAVIGLGYLLEQTTLTESQYQYLSKIQFAGRSLLSVVNNVLDLAKIEAREVSLEVETFDLPALLLDTSELLAPQATAKGIEVLVQPATDLPRMVVGDVSRLRQILTNLLSNAIKFTDTGHVELKACCTELGSDRMRLRCEVIDTGIGIEAAAVKRMFVPFTQADASTTRRFGGTGLGLSITRHLVELMGGEIDATSTLAVGSTFWFEIPLRIAHDEVAPIIAPGFRIAFVDSGAAAGLTGMVRAMGWTSHVVSTAEELLGFLSNAQPNTWPHVLIAPLQLPDMDIHQLIGRFESEFADSAFLPVIAISDSAQSYLTHQPLMRSADVLLMLPLTSSALFNAVNTAISEHPDGREDMLQFTETG